MKRSLLFSSASTCLCLCLAGPLLAAPAPTNDPPPSVAAINKASPTASCQVDVHNFNRQMETGGYWMGGSDYGYGYPMGGMGYFAGGLGDRDVTGGADLQETAYYRNARPGYEIRILLASANILARNGQQQGCEDVLETTRGIYKVYLADMQERGVMPVDGSAIQKKQIAAALPVTEEHMAFRADELLDTAVIDTADQSLGSVDDIVTDPKTGRIAYLVIARGGLLGFDKKYVPVPWGDFKVTQGVTLLVLNTTKAAMEAAPEVGHAERLTPAQYDQESAKVDAYWTSHVPAIAAK